MRTPSIPNLRRFGWHLSLMPVSERLSVRLWAVARNLLFFAPVLATVARVPLPPPGHDERSTSTGSVGRVVLSCGGVTTREYDEVTRRRRN